MQTLKDKIVETLNRHVGLTDRELTHVITGKSQPQQSVNGACRELEKFGRLVRRPREDGLIGNYLVDGAINRIPAGKRVPRVDGPNADAKAATTDGLSEDTCKELLVKWLEKRGWTATVAWSQMRGIYIEARRGTERWVIEVKGCGSRQPMRVNYFLAILGEILQRMSDPNTKYSIALPNMTQFRNLWDRLPALAKNRLTVTALFIDANGSVQESEAGN